MKPILLNLLILFPVIASSLKADETITPASVFLFVIPDCPIVNRYAPEINRIYDTYSKEGVELTLVYTEPSLTRKDIENHRTEYSLKPEGILDPDFELVKMTGATITPEAAVYNAERELVYLGRIDDWFTDFGDKRREPTERNLRLALDAVLAGEKVQISRARAIGCFIEY